MSFKTTSVFGFRIEIITFYEFLISDVSYMIKLYSHNFIRMSSDIATFQYRRLQNQQLLLNGFYCDRQIIADQPASFYTKPASPNKNQHLIQHHTIKNKNGNVQEFGSIF